MDLTAPMKIRLLSDLHIEFGKFDTEFKNQADVCLLAGDIGIAQTSEMMNLVLEVAAQHKRTILLPGNHEFYDRHIEDAVHWMKDTLISVVNDHGHHLEVFSPYGSMEYEGVPFVGGTFWTNLNGPDDESYDYRTFHLVRRRMNDYRCIRKGGHQLDPISTWQENKDGRIFISDYLRKANNPRAVVVTHHAPLVICSDAVYRTDPLTGGYCNTRLEPWFDELPFSTWCHGHCHNINRLDICGKNVFSNTRGYHGYAETQGFDRDFIFEV